MLVWLNGEELEEHHSIWEQLYQIRMYFSDAAIFFSSRLLQVARDFIAKSLGPFFVSEHNGAEKVLVHARSKKKLLTLLGRSKSVYQI